MASKRGSESLKPGTRPKRAPPRPAPAPPDFAQVLGIADALPMPIALLDKERRYIFCNRAFADFFERPRSQILGRTVLEMLGPQLYEVRKPMMDAAFSGERQFFVADFPHSSRGPLAIQAEYVPQFGPGGSVEGIVVLVTDVTEQRTAERALKESEARFRRIADSAPAMMWVTRLDRSRDFVNEAYAEFACGPGCDPEEARSLDWRGRIHPDDLDRIVAESIAGEASRRMFTLEGRYKRHDGEYRWLRSVSQPRFGPDGELAGFIGVATDITLAKEAELDLKAMVEAQAGELVLAQEQLRQSQKMEALGQLTGGIAHDFNNLLTVIVGGLDQIARQVKEERLKRYAANALTAAERGARLTAQLLAFSRVQRLEVKPTLVAPLIEGMRPLLKNVLGPGIEKRFELSQTGIPIMADPTQLELAVLNLAINARDAMEAGGILTFATQAVSIAGDPELEDGDYVELSVRDTGAGMDEEVVARAFEPFFTTKEVGKGTGLGLSMVYGVARQSGGTARIDSKVGEGTCVRLYFRRAEETVEEAAESGSAGRKGSRRKASVLVVDDDPDVRDFIAVSLGDYGYAVREAADGAGGLKAFGEKRPDLVILDYAMPGMSGSEVAARMLREVPGQPILFVSGYNETEAIRAAAPDALLLAKPFRPDALDAAVRECLDSKRPDSGKKP
jgi:PAS domain S-box-containing protein